MILEPGLDLALRNKEIIGMIDRIKIQTLYINAAVPEFDHYTVVM